MSKGKENETGLTTVMSIDDLRKLQTQEKATIVILPGSHTKHLVEGSEHEVSGIIAAELISSKKAILK